MLTAPGEGVPTREMTRDRLAPAQGEALIARGRVERAGRRPSGMKRPR